jgi:tRNA U34 2-thiouridine synthase MnmA/TrmU
MDKGIRAIGLFSGGLDSMLAVRLLQDQGVHVTGIVFVTPFFGSEAACRARESLGIPLVIEEITELYMDQVLAGPRYGFGKNMNPCIDCHAFMFRLAGKRMEEDGARFLFSGEVLGQRPFSQNRGALNAVAELSGYPEVILRPLSARRLKETRMEKEGVVDRDRLLDLQGRSRKPQMAWAETFGISTYPSPAGGCLLTQPDYSRRLRDLLRYDPEPSVRDLEMLKSGRHLRCDPVSKIVVGRREQENNTLEQLWMPGDVCLQVEGIPGPTVLLLSSGEPSGEALVFAARLAVRYSDADPGADVDVAYTDGDRKGVLHAAACDDEEIRKRMI